MTLQEEMDNRIRSLPDKPLLFRTLVDKTLMGGLSAVGIALVDIPDFDGPVTSKRAGCYGLLLGPEAKFVGKLEYNFALDGTAYFSALGETTMVQVENIMPGVEQVFVLVDKLMHEMDEKE